MGRAKIAESNDHHLQKKYIANMGSKTCKILHQVKNEHHFSKINEKPKKTNTNL